MDRVAEPLKFTVLDDEDLEVVATHLQDAVVKVADVIWQPEAHRFGDWPQPLRLGEQAIRGQAAELPPPFGPAVRPGARPSSPAASIPPATDGTLNLLTVEFTETEAPSGDRDPQFSRAMRPFGSMSNVWKANWSIWARSGPAPDVRSTPSRPRTDTCHSGARLLSPFVAPRNDGYG